MMRIKAKSIVLVSPRMLSDHAFKACENLKHVTDATQIFPAIFEMKPELVVFDIDFIGEDIYKIVRRIRTNGFYDRTKICCYKTSFKLSEEGLLKSLGVNELVNAKEIEEQKNNSFAFGIHSLLSNTVSQLLFKA